MPDVLLLGKGPAALAAAAALAERGLQVAVVGPAGPIRWPAQYGAWDDDLAALGLADLAEYRWPGTRVTLHADEHLELPRAYVRVDREALLRSLVARCERAGVRWHSGVAREVAHHPAHSVVRCQGGPWLPARLVVDASGHRPALVHRRESPPAGFQTAVGLTLEVEHSPFDAARALLMDWSDEHLPAAARAGAPPTFLYALPLRRRRLFVEETALAARPAVPFALLEERLHQRLGALGIHARAVVEREHCWIPMGGALPDLRQRVVGFGGAAGMVHPATGYLLTRVLADAPALADAIARSLGSSAPPEHAAHAAWAALWSADRVRRHAFFRFGMEVLLQLDAPATRAFFHAFFRLPPEDWRGYLGDSLPASTLATVMGRLFHGAPATLRHHLARPLLGPGGAHLLRSMLQSAVG